MTTKKELPTIRKCVICRNYTWAKDTIPVLVDIQIIKSPPETHEIYICKPCKKVLDDISKGKGRKELLDGPQI